MIGKLLTAKVAAGLAVGALTVGTAAAAVSGALPGQGSGSHGPAHVTVGGASNSGSTSDHHPSHGAPSFTSGANSANPSSKVPATGPANSHAQFGLCTAFLNFNTATQKSLPPQDSSTAFKALITQNSGVPKTVTYCEGVVKTPPSDNTGSSGDTAKPSGAGKPSGVGKPAGVGQPPTPNDQAPSGTGSGAPTTHGSGASSTGAGSGHASH